MKPFYAYIVRCAGEALYVGHTDDLPKRIAEHESGMGSEYTAKRLPVEFVWACEFATRVEALEREAQIKGWSRAKKQALIDRDWDRVQALARSYGRSPQRKRG